MSYTYSSISNLKEQVNIVDVVGRALTLKKQGGRYVGLCPFHKEKTASFSVNEQMQKYYCFGCHEHGDVFNFVQKFYNLGFQEAIERLSSEYGIQMEESGYRSEDLSSYYKINQDAARFFYKSFTEGPNLGYAYMKNRGISPEILKKFGIGYADESWDSLYKHLVAQGHDVKKIMELGLVSQNKGKYYDRFRNRVMFPIINTNGKVIGFGGRAIDKDDSPKYLNSPESKVFQKKKNLYGLNLTRNAVSKEGYIILVEGYMDVIGLYQAGVENIGASLGTALTEEQARIIKRYAKRVVLSYDADNAGINAALRGMDILKAQECNVSVMHVTDGKDPDEFIKKEGKNSFLELVKNASDYAVYKYQYAIKDLNMSEHKDRIDAMRRISLVLSDQSPAEQEEYAEKAAKDYGLSKQAILNEIKKILQERAEKSNRLPERKPAEEAAPEEVSNIEADILKLVTQNESFIPRVNQETEIFTSNTARTIFDAIQNDASKDGSPDINRILDILDDPEKNVLTDILKKVLITGDEEKVYEDALRRVRLRTLIQESETIDEILKTEDYQEEDVEKLMQRKMELQELINKERI